MVLRKRFFSVRFSGRRSTGVPVHPSNAPVKNDFVLGYLTNGTPLHRSDSERNPSILNQHLHPCATDGVIGRRQRR